MDTPDTHSDTSPPAAPDGASPAAESAVSDFRCAHARLRALEASCLAEAIQVVVDAHSYLVQQLSNDWALPWHCATWGAVHLCHTLLWQCLRLLEEARSLNRSPEWDSPGKAIRMLQRFVQDHLIPELDLLAQHGIETRILRVGTRLGMPPVDPDAAGGRPRDD